MLKNQLIINDLTLHTSELLHLYFYHLMNENTYINTNSKYLCLIFIYFIPELSLWINLPNNRLSYPIHIFEQYNVQIDHYITTNKVNI